jgi:hypothetical protein
VASADGQADQGWQVRLKLLATVLSAFGGDSPSEINVEISLKSIVTATGLWTYVYVDIECSLAATRPKGIFQHHQRGMKPVTSSLVSCSSLFLRFASAQFTLTEIFAKYSQLSKLAALITNSTTLSARFFNQASNFTLLAPTDAAISTWLSSNLSQADVEAVLLYHLLDGRHPIASISNSSMVIPSALTNQTYANITGGQRVEVSNTGIVEFQSDAKAVSKIITGVGLSCLNFGYIC